MNAAKSPGDHAAEEEIDQLTKLGFAGRIKDPQQCWGDFAAIDAVYIPGTPQGPVDPVVRKLVRMGVTAVPSLIAHLSDQRETGLIVRPLMAGFGGTWFSNEYDSRYSDSALLPKGVNLAGLGGELGGGQGYTLRVGDVCYQLIGQIVNRNLSALRYQPSANQVINSPIQCPALAAAVKADWDGLTPREHEKELEEGCRVTFDFDIGRALERLAFYYPKDGERIALMLLRREIYSPAVTKQERQFLIAYLRPLHDNVIDKAISSP